MGLRAAFVSIAGPLFSALRNRSRMCSVMGCYSGRVPRFRLPEDPDMRLQWVQFLARVNQQRFKESSWRDIAICCEHFEGGCFENPSRSSPARLRPDAVPSLGSCDDGDSQEVSRAADAACCSHSASLCNENTTCTLPGMLSAWKIFFFCLFVFLLTFDLRRYEPCRCITDGHERIALLLVCISRIRFCLFVLFCITFVRFVSYFV